MNRSDGALVRVNTPIAHGETQEQAQQRLMSLLDHSSRCLINTFRANGNTRLKV
jgi:hypothetical protein